MPLRGCRKPETAAVSFPFAAVIVLEIGLQVGGIPPD